MTDVEDPNLVPQASDDGYQFDANPGAPKEGFQFWTVKNKIKKKKKKKRNKNKTKKKIEKKTYKDWK